MTTRLEVVRLDDIIVYPGQPRKTFDEKALAELSESVKKDGILQPILLRPIDPDSAENWIDLSDPQAKLKDRLPRFYLVCGERRYRASVMAGLEDIPANIRVLTDEQAFELQIIENLQRQDVHPLEEAEAYKRMLDSGRYTIPDIAAKLAKPEPFIQQRLKLNDLIPEIKQDFLHNELSIGHAVEIARISPELQIGLYKNYKSSWRVTGWGTLSELKKEISSQSYDLAKAPFKLEAIYGSIGSCNGCPFRTATNPVLFADMESDSCLNKPCYNTKTEAHIALQAEELIVSGENVMLVSYSNEFSPAIKAVSDKQKVPIVSNYKTYQSANHSKQKVFHVTGSKAGQTEDVWVPTSLVKNSATTGAVDIKAEIDKIEVRAKRQLELDQEKIFLSIVDAMKGDFVKSKIPDYRLEPVFVDAMLFYIAITTESYYVRDEVSKITNGLTMDVKTPEQVVELYTTLTPDQRKRLMVLVAFRKWNGMPNDGSFQGKVIRKLADSNPRIDVAGIVAAQNEIATARIAKTETRLAELRKKLEKPKKESKKKPVKQ